MMVVRARPPLWDEIDQAFHIAGRPIIFAWGDTIYDPEGAGVSPALHMHEGVHGARQTAAGVEIWWRTYIADPEFRLAEEIPAHQAEFRWWCESPLGNQQVKGFRSAKDRQLLEIARRLSSPLYGGVISFDAARKLLKAA